MVELQPRRFGRGILGWVLALGVGAPAAAQTTQGLISGRLVDSVSGRPIGGASITYTSDTSTPRGSSLSDQQGYYALPLLSPGIYRVRATAAGYQAQEAQQLELAVASRIDLSFRLRPLSDVWEAGQLNSVFLPGSRTIVTFFGPDVDATRTGSFEANRGRRAPLESTVSNVIRSSDIADLPLAGRDVYTMLVTQPGVTSDGATARGLGLAANGQRPSASNFLLDGLENNNYLITGPLVTVAPQAVQEYRVSTNNYSAEYGRTSGYLANAITRSGANQFHGTGYLYLKNEILNANGFQDNLAGRERSPYKEHQPGFWVGGPAIRNRLYFSSAYEYFRSRGRAVPLEFRFPNTPVFFEFAAPGRQSRALLEQYPVPVAVGGPGLTGVATLAPPVSVNRHLAIERVDFDPGVKDRVSSSFLLARVTRPDFIWSPYPDFVSQLHQDTWRVGGSHTHTFSADLINEFRAAFSNDDLSWDRPHPEVPTLAVGDGTILPGSLAFYEYQNINRSMELLDNTIWTRGAHRFTFGAGALLRSSRGYLTAGRDGQYLFGNMIDFAFDRPTFFRAAIQRNTLPDIRQPDPKREYRYRQYFGFAQDTVRLTDRLTLNLGLRYEYFGAPSNTGPVKDGLIQPGPGASLAAQLASAGPLVVPAAGDQQLFGTDQANWAVRLGASYDLTGVGRTILRASYGIFYDRPFDNLWQNVRSNNFILPLVRLTGTVNYLAGVQTILNTLAGRTFSTNFPSQTLVDADLRNGRVHSYFVGVQHQVMDRMTLELNALGSYGRRLITTDIVNRDFSTPEGRYNPAYADISYRSDQGFSNYNAFTATLRYTAGRGTLHAAYTWSHAIDNQSEPLAGDFFNLTFTSFQTNPSPNGKAAFSRQFDPQADRGTSDFDQRHSLVLYYVYYLPNRSLGGLSWLTRDWMVAGLTAFRSGFPYTLVSPTDVAAPGAGLILNNRPNLLAPGAAKLAEPADIPGGKQLLNPAAFQAAAPSTLGNLGRNSLAGPGFYNLDVSLSRFFPARWLGEGGRLVVRADVFNVLNHANLGNPETLVGSPTFGAAQYGRIGRASGFPAVSPLSETARQFQMSARIDF
jgi:hypothetical protein